MGITPKPWKSEVGCVTKYYKEVDQKQFFERYNMNILVILIGCPGDTTLRVYRDLTNSRYMETFRSTNYTYGFDRSFEYQFTHGSTILDSSCVTRMDLEEPNHTGFDDEMIYRKLAGLNPGRSYNGIDRVRIILSSPENLVGEDGLLTAFAKENMSMGLRVT
jgi:hypothetical protein